MKVKTGNFSNQFPRKLKVNQDLQSFSKKKMKGGEDEF